MGSSEYSEYSYFLSFCPRGKAQFKVLGLSAKNSHGRQNKSKRISKIRDACEITGKDTEKGDDAWTFEWNK